MRITHVTIKNLRSFKHIDLLPLSPKINLLIGANNSGKSTIIKALNLIQIPRADVELPKLARKGSNPTLVSLRFDELSENYFSKNTVTANPSIYEKEVYYSINRIGSIQVHQVKRINSQNVGQVQPCPNTEPNNFIYPYFSKRKTVVFDETINKANSIAVKENMVNLYSKVDRISNAQHPHYKEYSSWCERILGFQVTASASSGGKQAGIIIGGTDYIPISEMGEGTTNILGLLVDLCVAEGKLFLIEELENDLHPKALKILLELIAEKSSNNQFVISTHSNIVVKQLGVVQDTKMFAVDMKIQGKLPTSTVLEVEDDPSKRVKLLEDLGYDLFDFDLWKAYLILEESTAERIIRDVLIPWFAPKLQGKLKTIAANGVTDLEPRFQDFLRLFVFIHTTEAYSEKAWVYADGDAAGVAAVDKLKSKFPSWHNDHFQTFSKANFEEYYPEPWKQRAAEVIRMPHGNDKQREKGKLVNEIMAWVAEDESTAKSAFEESASEVIGILQSIQEKLGSTY